MRFSPINWKLIFLAAERVDALSKIHPELFRAWAQFQQATVSTFSIQLGQVWFYNPRSDRRNGSFFSIRFDPIGDFNRIRPSWKEKVPYNIIFRMGLHWRCFPGTGPQEKRATALDRSWGKLRLILRRRRPTSFCSICSGIVMLVFDPVGSKMCWRSFLQNTSWRKLGLILRRERPINSRHFRGKRSYVLQWYSE